MWSQHREQRRADSWGSLASQPSLPGKLQANDKACLINKESEGQKLGLHMHVHTHAHVYTYKRRKEERERKGKSRSCSFIQCLGFQCEAREMLDTTTALTLPIAHAQIKTQHRMAPLCTTVYQVKLKLFPLNICVTMNSIAPVPPRVTPL